MVRFDKRAQAALEFLMTYSWAILVVIIIIGALAYFGVLNPQSLVPEKCTVSAGLSCDDYGIQVSGSNGIVTLAMINSLGKSISIDSVNVTGTSLTGSGATCNVPGGASADIVDQTGNTMLNAGAYVVPNGEKFTVQITDPDCLPIDPSSKTRATIEISYHYTGSNVPHKSSGELFVKPVKA